MKFEKTHVSGWEAAVRGMRNPLESWDKIDSKFLDTETPWLGDNDLRLMKKLVAAGSEHRKFLRYIHVSVDITAPLFYWKEFDTYKIATVANSTSTMHKITSKPITLNCFETDDYNGDLALYDDLNISVNEGVVSIISFCEKLRKRYLETKNLYYWKELIRWLPESWLQTRTIDLNYEVLRTIVRQREFHKLSEWSKSFMDWVRTLPYSSELIFTENDN